ncbi:transglycosylase SLT domain-containing protein, partial [Daejeonella sp.]|uniref:lytic transglycosylase domain-containing protein n=1 Tax=Daejeonella sp. TaxID=2805397 RepID=UPI0039838978
MMRTFTFVVLALLCTADRTNASLTTPFIGLGKFSQIKLKSKTVSADTGLVAASSTNPELSFQDLLFKSRLDSLEKSVPLNYNEHVRGYINIYLNRKEQIGKMLGLSNYYFPIFEKVLMEAGLPNELKFLTVIESTLNPHAVSRSGAVGPWQFMYTTAKGYGLVMDSYVDERKDPVKASYAAAHYFVDAYKKIGDWLLTIAAFNCGTGAVTRAIVKSGGIPDFWRVRAFLPKETQNYVPAFIATVYAMNYYQNHGIESRPPGFNIFTDVIQVNKMLSIHSVAKAANLDLKELLILNPSYKKQIINGSVQNPKSLVIPDVAKGAFASLYNVLNGLENEYPETITALGKSASTEGPGQNIRLSAIPKSSVKGPETPYMNYIVKVGDTLSGIAEKFSGMTVSKIKALNGLTKSAINPGMKLIINRL